MKKKDFFSEFPPVKDKEWKEKAIKDLKGVDFDKKLVWKTGEGFDVLPWYTRSDLAGMDMLDICPGDFPFVRGKRIKGNEWLVRQDITVDDVGEANLKALDIRMKGVDSFGFLLPESATPDENYLEKLLHNIRADVMELNFNSQFPLELVQSINGLCRKYNRDMDKIKGSVDFDPLGNLSRKGKFEGSKEQDFSLLEELLKSSAYLPYFHVITVDGSLYHNAGSGIVTQLAFTLAKGAEYLTYLTDRGFEVDEVSKSMRFHFAVGSNYFMEIAKFRAARYLWANIVNAYGVSEAANTAMFIHCSSSNWNKTQYDPYVNMLRTTTEAMSAVLGGVDSLTVLPFDAPFRQPDDFSQRIARNQQLLLKGESYFDKVADPAAGSYYIENLTKSIIDKVWELFLEVDTLGGYDIAFEKGFITQKIREEAAEKDRAIAFRKRVLLGTNQYPDLSEHHKSEFSVEKPGSTHDKGIKPGRAALAFERIRHATDIYASKEKRPTAWMFTYGNLAMRNARAQFAANFFGCAGFDIVSNPGFKIIEQGIDKAKKDKPDIVVICSSDKEYADHASTIFHALREETIVVLAGYPKELVDALTEAGLTNFIHTGCNVLEELVKYQNMLGIH